MSKPREGLTPLQFWNRCARHDWHHSLSDDMRVWRKGRADRLALEEAADSDARLKLIWDQWFEHIRGQRKELPPVPTEGEIATGTNT